MASTDGSDGNPVDVTEHATEHVEATQVLPGDDITVIPDPHDGGNRRRVAWIAGGVTAVLLVAGAIVLATRDDDPNATVATGVSTTTLAETPNAAATTPTIDKPTPTTIPTQQASPGTAAAPVVVPQNPVAVAPPPTVPPTAPPVVPTTVVGASPTSAIRWTAPASVTLKTGSTKLVKVSAHNPTAGVISLPQPLRCAPTLDNGTFCTAVIQEIQPGQTALETWSVSAAGIAPGSYTLNFAGLLKIPVTVTA